MNIPENLLYTNEHEWVLLEGDIATIGITDYAQGELGDIVFVDLPQKNASTKQMQTFGTIEAVKTVSDLYAPLSGEIVDVNATLAEKPELINSDCYGAGWLIKVKVADKSETQNLLSPADYKGLVA
jgi:glycine cleavage system H protein